MHHGKKVYYSASCLSSLTAIVICEMSVVKVSKKAVLKAEALSDSYRCCDNSSTHVCLLGDNICAVCEKLSFVRSRYAGGSNACNVITEVGTITYLLQATYSRKKKCSAKNIDPFFKFHKTG